MQLEVGKIYEGKVTGITKFGAFVEVTEDGKRVTGMVHISEVANTFVNEIKDHVQDGQTVNVKVLSVTDDGKISMSIKKALPQQENREGGFRRSPRPERTGGNGNAGAQGGFRKPNNFVKRDNNFKKDNAPASGGFRQPQGFGQSKSTLSESGNSDFEDMLNKFKASSEEKISDMKKVKENKRRSNSHRK